MLGLGSINASLAGREAQDPVADSDAGTVKVGIEAALAGVVAERGTALPPGR